MAKRERYVTRPNPYGNGVDLVRLSPNADPLEQMYARRQITEEQKKAGDRMQKAFVALSGSLGIGMDLTQDKVDTSGVSQELPASIIEAQQDIATAVKLLGRFDHTLMGFVCGAGMTIAQCADQLGLKTKADREYLGKRFRHALDTLAADWGYSRPSRQHSVISSFTVPAGEGALEPANEPGAFVYTRDIGKDGRSR